MQLATKSKFACSGCLESNSRVKIVALWAKMLYDTLKMWTSSTQKKKEKKKKKQRRKNRCQLSHTRLLHLYSCLFVNRLFRFFAKNFFYESGLQYTLYLEKNLKKWEKWGNENEVLKSCISKLKVKKWSLELMSNSCTQSKPCLQSEWARWGCQSNFLVFFSFRNINC